MPRPQLVPENPGRLVFRCCLAPTGEHTRTRTAVHPRCLWPRTRALPLATVCACSPVTGTERRHTHMRTTTTPDVRWGWAVARLAAAVRA